jgi:sensor histidine kinase YesM
VPGGNSAARILLFYLVYSSVYVAEYLLLRNREDAVNIENTTMIIQSVIFLFCSVILSVLSYNYIVSNEALVGTPAVFVVSMFGVVMCVNIIIGLLDSFQTRKVQDELAMTRKLWQENVRQYELTKQTVDILNFRYHDLRNQMNLLVQDRGVAQEIENCLDSYYDSIRTGNEAMDVVLTEKSVLCRKNEIVFTCIADGQCLSYMSPVDIYSVLGNIIDNAVEYLSAIADKEKRVISLMIRREGDMDMIQIENFLAERPREEQGMPLTTKKDKENHGYGLKSVRHILKKYEGIMRISMENRMFSLTIALPQKK